MKLSAPSQGVASTSSGSSGTDADAWHKTADSFGGTSGYTIGTADGNALTIKTNNVSLQKFEAGAAPSIYLGNSLSKAYAGFGTVLQYRRTDAWANLCIVCDQDGSGGQGTGESLLSLNNDTGAGLVLNAIGSVYAGSVFNSKVSVGGQARVITGGGLTSLCIGGLDATVPVWIVGDTAKTPMAKVNRESSYTVLNVYGSGSDDVKIALFDSGAYATPTAVWESLNGDVYFTTVTSAKSMFLRTNAGARITLTDSGIDFNASVVTRFWNQTLNTNDSVGHYVRNANAGNIASAQSYWYSETANITISAHSSGFTTSHGRAANDTCLFADGASLKLITITGGTAPIVLMPGETEMLRVTTDSKISVFGATPVVKQTVSGAKLPSDTVLASLLTALSNYGFITDSST